MRIREAGFALAAMCLLIMEGCSSARKSTTSVAVQPWDVTSGVKIKTNVPPRKIEVKNVDATELTAFAETLVGIPYKYGSVKKEDGFDCSGFISYVFNHYKISVPRTTVAFTNAGEEVSIRNSKRGDIILFTGSDASSGVVGHMGIITENKKNNFWFIHASTSQGVMLSTLNSYFSPRFVKVIRLFKD